MEIEFDEAKIELEIRKKIAGYSYKKGDIKFVIAPFGMMGEIVKNILNNKIGIKEYALLDNNKDGETFQGIKIHNFEFLKDCKEEIFILVSCIRWKKEVTEQLEKYVDDEHIIDFEVNHNAKVFEKYCTYKVGGKKNFGNSGYIYEICPYKYPVKFYLPFYETDFIQKSIILRDTYYEAYNLVYIADIWKGGCKEKIKGSLVLDIGANIGNHSLFYALECMAGKVIAFEPIIKTYEILCKNIKINHMEDIIIPKNVAIGEYEGKARARGYDLRNIGGTHIVISQDGDLDVIAIDEMSFDERISFIKIDVEGFELNVIRGAMQTIRKNEPIICLESFDRDRNIVEIIQLLASLGYSYEQMTEQDYLFFIEGRI